MAFFAQLQSQLKSRRDYVDAASTVASGQGEGIRLADVGAPGGHKFFSFRDFQDGSATGYRGLRNQGATCYLNSLLQACYMTPEFRGGLYSVDPGELNVQNWNAEDGGKDVKKHKPKKKLQLKKHLLKR